MRKVYVTLEIEVCLEVDGDTSVQEAVDNLEVSVTPCDEYLDDVYVLDASVLDSTITDVK